MLDTGGSAGPPNPKGGLALIHVSAALASVVLSRALVARVRVSPAIAKPPDPGSAVQPPKPRQRYPDRRDIPAREQADIALAVRLARHTVHRNVLDYRAANTYDRGRVTFRRKFAAGVLVSGGRITHPSKTEQRRVRAYIPKGDPYRALPHDARAGLSARATGDLVRKKPRPRYTEVWYNSCQTALMIFASTSIAVLVGVLAVFPLLTFTAVVVSAVVALGTAYIVYRRDLSPVMSISAWVRGFLLGCRSQW